ncbi:MAG: phosphatase PAP2 family protein [Tepidisphaeraceae bacterium]
MTSLDIARPAPMIGRIMAIKPRVWKKTALVIAAMAALFLVALALDVGLSSWAHDSGLAPWLKNNPVLAHFIRVPGHFVFYSLPVCAAILLCQWAGGLRRGAALWKDPAIVLLAGIFSGINAPLKWAIGRIRPFHGVPPFELHPFKGGLLGLFNAEASLSFPSGDVSLAVAMSMSLTIVMPRFWPLWWTLALIVALERIAENAHYPSDTIAGAAVGIAAALLAEKTVRLLAAKDENPSSSTPVVI